MKPGDFALRSKQSRAAARLILDQRTRSLERIEVIIACGDDNRPSATPWGKDKDGLGRVIGIPEGMTIADGLRTLGGYSEDELEEISASCPQPVGPGSLFALWR